MLTDDQLATMYGQAFMATDSQGASIPHFGRLVEAAANAEARATIQQLVDALGWLHLGEGPEARVGPALEAGRAWLGEAQKGDGHA